MKSLVKVAIAGALSLSATSAFASLSAPWNNNSDLLLVIENSSTHDTYSLDTGISLNSVMPGSGFVSGASLNSAAFTGINNAIAASPGLASFLSTNPASGDVWTIEGGQYNGGGSATAGSSNNTRPQGGGISIFSSANGTANNSNVTTKILTNMNSFLNGLNTDVTSSTGSLFGLTSASESTCTACTTSGAEDRYGFWTSLDWNPLGTTPVQLFGFTGNNGTGKLQSYILGTVTVGTNGGVQFAENQTSVPLPAAAWLFGSGLLGLFGVARRRAAAA
jgi:hypothetical protein